MLTSWQRRASWICVGALGLVVRLAYVLWAAPRRLPFTDAAFYQLWANFIAKGHGFANPLVLAVTGRSVPSAAHPPLFPLALAAGSLVGGTSVEAHEMLGAVIGVGTVLVVGLVAKEVAGERVGLLAAALAAIYPPLWLNDGGIMAEGLFALISAVVVLVSYRFAAKPSLRMAVLLGATIGLAILTRAEAVLLVLILVVPLVVAARRLDVGRRLRLLAVAVVATTAVVSPWVIRNLVSFQRPVVFSTGDGVLAGANCDSTYYRHGFGLWHLGCSPRPTSGDESVLDARARQQGLTYIRHHLGRVPIVVAVRVARVWDLYHPLENASIVEDGRPKWGNRLGLLAYASLAPLALAGAVVLRHRHVRLLPLVAQVVEVTLTAALTWGAIRFRAPAEVVVVVLGGVALDAGWRRAARSRPARPAKAAPPGVVYSRSMAASPSSPADT